MPELLYTLFFIGAMLAYVRYVQNADRRAYAASIVFLIAGLLSKEAAIMLPAALCAAGILLGSSGRRLRERVIWTIRSIAPHVLICIVYFAFAVGYLNVMGLSFGKLLERPQTPAPGDYIPVFNREIFKNADLAATWAFNIPRGWWGQWQQPKPGMLAYLKLFRMLVLALAALTLFRPERKVIALGVLWFWLTILPALPLITHFLPYYLFLPVAGLSLVVGAGFIGLYDALSRIRPALAAATIVILLAGVLLVTSRSIRNEIAGNRLLGGSATLASNTLKDLKGFYPSLHPEAKLYFADGRESLAWDHDSGGLIKMAYGVDAISVGYESSGDSLSIGDRSTLVFGVHNGRLSDESAKYRSRPVDFMKFVTSDLKLDLSAGDVGPGDRYSLAIKSLNNSAVRIAYMLNDGPIETFDVLLDADGKAVFDVSPQTRKGVYTFSAFSAMGSDQWIRTDKKLTVR